MRLKAIVPLIAIFGLAGCASLDDLQTQAGSADGRIYLHDPALETAAKAGLE